MKPYYQDDLVTIYHGDCLEITEWLDADVLITDPPYGINYLSGARRNRLAASITGDKDASLRDKVIERWGDRPAIIFGTWRVNRPLGTVARLIWDTKGALGMGDLSIPWKPSDQEIYILGSGFSGRRTSNVLSFAPVQSMARNGRLHPHQKPVPLLLDLLRKCPAGTVSDPFMGSGSTLVAAKSLGRKAIGVEIEEKYCEIAARRCAQDYLFGGVA
ncbi:MAG: site-specific DNA-methyltransferase [Patescibacteria group bacterium]|nr:site-specific DNA-methyltransferase [Patescibacteria group bacterium]